MKKRERAKILSHVEIAADIFEMWLETEAAGRAKPGQFIGVFTGDKSMLLLRPISICEVKEDGTALRIVYRRGEPGTGTYAVSQCLPQSSVEILGPLGNGFPLEAGEGKRALLVGGGIGIPPLVELAKRLDAKKQIAVGYRGSGQFFLDRDLAAWGELFLATEDGSSGTKGNVMDAIFRNGLEADVIYACGPMPMLRAVKELAAQRGIPAYLSLEERMACGVGACLGCVVKTEMVHHHTNVGNARICTDGPVFEAGEVSI